MAFKATLNSHLRSFQFKIINRILITNRPLNVYQIKNSENCELMNTYFFNVLLSKKFGQKYKICCTPKYR